MCVLICPQVEVASGENVSGNYEEMYVQVSAETYEKVDAAVALIELLVTPVSVSTVVWCFTWRYCKYQMWQFSFSLCHKVNCSIWFSGDSSGHNHKSVR